MLLFAGVVGCAQDSSSHRSVDTLLPDLDLQLACTKRYLSEIEDPTLLFMEREGLRTLNKGRLKREHFGSDVHGAEIIAIEPRGRYILELMQSPFVESEYTVFLYSKPPTLRTAELEERIERFMSALASKLSCQVTSVIRHENGAKALRMYEITLSTITGWFEQAEAVDETQVIREQA